MMHGHFWTIAPHLRDQLRESSFSGSPWTLRHRTVQGEFVCLRGHLVQRAHRRLLVLVHGLGGSAESGYVRRAARLAEQRGFDTLRLHLRGADRASGDFYHAGLVEDLRAVSDSSTLATYPQVFWLGFSLGGHVVLRALALGLLRADAAATICSPLDLELSCGFIDRPEAWPYRRYLLRGLVEMYRAVCSHRTLPLSLSQAREIRSIREWDERVVAPRFGFAGASDYYRKMSVAPLLPDISCRTQMVVAQRDPMVGFASLAPHLGRVSSQVEVRICKRGGHVGFPPRADPLADTLSFLGS